MDKTENLGLWLPDDTDPLEVSKLSENFNVLDKASSALNYHVGLITVTVTTQSGSPVRGVEIDNVFSDFDCEVPAVTNSDGVAKGYIPEGQQTFGVKNYLDIKSDVSKSLKIVQANTYEETLKITPRNFIKITSSKDDCRFSGNVSRADITVVGGGGSGGSGHMVDPPGDFFGGSGGGGGGVLVQERISLLPNLIIRAAIGAGGAAVEKYASNGKSGGDTSFGAYKATGGGGGGGGQNNYAKKGVGGTPNGGDGGSGGYGGEESVPPTDGSDGVHGYSSFTDTLVYGSGGGAGNIGSTTAYLGAKGGEYSGGNGSPYGSLSTPASAGIDGGGGGGGRSRKRDETSPSMAYSAAGGNGLIAIRMHLIATT